ncbi:Uncharacterized HTH-type transcriptional regulator yurK [Slackia heliotrinireducens]|nr:GntR family transcriptional regulator [Slackia heliotrinireducens]VEG98806.1 Uncharacterized HTH-type transcriptional regulator yurK [Slackia heliotrinireducens]
MPPVWQKENQQTQAPLADKSLIAIDESSGVPLWIQLRNRLVFLIVSGTFLPGQQLPTVRELCAELNVNYNTVSKVYKDIEKDGYVITRRGKGTFVAELDLRDASQQEGIAAANLLVDKFLDEMKELGLTASDAASLVAERVGGRFV